MLRYFVIFILLNVLPFGESQAQIKNKFKDKNDDNRTIVIKEQQADDYRILEEQFGDAAVGEVIRITTAKVKVEKVKKTPTKKIAPPKARPQKSKTQVSKPEPQKIKVPEKKSIPKPAATKPKKQIKRPDGPSGIKGTYPIKSPSKKKKVRVKRRKKFKPSKRGSCFQF